jgi:hypothetical protein
LREKWLSRKQGHRHGVIRLKVGKQAIQRKVFLRASAMILYPLVNNEKMNKHSAKDVKGN